MRYPLNPLLVQILLVPFVLGPPSPARADSIFDRYFSGSHISFELSDDTITDTSKFEAELELRYRFEGISAFLRATNDRPFAYQRDQFNVEKWGFNYQLNDDWEATCGDFSLVFGRGTALNAIETRDVDRDAQLEGVMVAGDLGTAALTAFWGQHKSDGMEYYVSGVNTTDGDPADELKGGRLALDFGDIDLGASWIDADMVRFREPLSTAVTELDASWRIDPFRLYYETVWFNRDEPEGSEESADGRAHVAEVIYAEPGLSLAGSWVRYEDAHFDYATAPSLRRPEVEDSAARENDETGWRLDCRLSPESWDGNSLRLLYTDLEGIELEEQEFRNFFAEWASPVTEEWSGTLSYDRIKGLLLYYGGINGTDESFRATVDGPFPFGGTFHLSGRYRLLASEFESDDELQIGFDWHVSPDFTLGCVRETSTRPTEPPPPGFPGIPTESPGRWNSAFIRWLPDPWTQVDLMIGSQRGGFQCSGGTCAQLPPFKGVRFTYYRAL
jgi:hypothetical protein